MKNALKRSQIAQSQSIPAPVGGLNARDGLAEMPESDAVVMTNFFPNPSQVVLRSGYVTWATGTGPVNTLAAYKAPGGTRKLFAASGTKIFDVTTAGAVGAAVVTGQTSGYWQTINFGTGGGQFLYMVNGVDSPQLFNGSTWQAVTAVSAPISITGVTTTTLIHVNAFKSRLFFIEKNAMHAWFLPLNSVGGAASLLDFSSLTKLGGYLVAMMTWTIDNTSGIQEMAAFITSEGEVLLYSGSDPSFASSWFQVGSFRIGRPIGRRCYERIGSDVVVITADGLFPLSEALLTDRSQRKDALSDKIRNLINNDVQTYAANPGWQVILYPIGNKVIVNVPAGAGTYQYVMNTLHGAWCIFRGWSATCFELLGDLLFFGGAGGVYQADTGTTDNGTNIMAVAVQAPNYFGTNSQKQFTLARPVLFANAQIRPSFSINVDFDISAPASASSYTAGAYTPWGSPWGSPWSPLSQVYKDWQSMRGIGFTGSPAMAVSLQNVSMTWQATDVLWINGDPL